VHELTDLIDGIQKLHLFYCLDLDVITKLSQTAEPDKSRDKDVWPRESCILVEWYFQWPLIPWWTVASAFLILEYVGGKKLFSPHVYMLLLTLGPWQQVQASRLDLARLSYQPKRKSTWLTLHVMVLEYVFFLVSAASQWWHRERRGSNRNLVVAPGVEVVVEADLFPNLKSE
jgi:hypothetical protein